jgi:general secretion pathway protein K
MACRDRGFALLLVLIVLATLSLIVAASVDAARKYAHEAVDAFAALKEEAALDGALATAERDLVEAGAVSPQLLSRPGFVDIGGIHVRIEAKSEGGKIDINAAPVELLGSLLVASGVSREQAITLADEIADWRDLDGDRRRHGAEAADYLAAGRGYAPANRKFESPSGLAMILDGGQDLADCLAGDVTVFTGRPDVEPVSASPRVLNAARMSPATAAAGQVSVVGGRAIAVGEVFDISVSARDAATGRRRALHSIVRMTGNPREPVWTLTPLAAPLESDDASCRRLSARGRHA